MDRHYKFTELPKRIRPFSQSNSVSKVKGAPRGKEGDWVGLHVRSGGTREKCFVLASTYFHVSYK